MKKIFLIITLCLSTYTICLGQKLYVWCPEKQEIKQRMGFLENQEINIIIFDGRTIPEKSKVECQGSGVIEGLYSVIKQAYPSAKLNLLGESEYYKKAEPGKVTIKIGIAAYQAGFGTDVTIGIGNIGGSFSYGLVAKSQWNGVTSYYAQIFDNRNTPGGKFEKEISRIESKSNMWGYKSAKTCLNTTFTEANQDLLFFIEKSLME